MGLLSFSVKNGKQQQQGAHGNIDNDIPLSSCNLIIMNEIFLPAPNPLWALKFLGNNKEKALLNLMRLAEHFCSAYYA